MRRIWLILLAGVVLAFLAFSGVYFACTAGHAGMKHGAVPELAWLKEEFQLTNAEFARISQLHEQYLGDCGKRCLAIDAKNAELARLLKENDQVTPQIEKLLREAAQLRADCQKAMLQHFYEVSRSMPPAQGKRYLDWVQQQTVLADTHSSMH